MSDLNSGRSKSSSLQSTADEKGGGGGSWKSFDNSMNAISFGVVATAILVSMFIIMAIFEHLFRPNASHHHHHQSTAAIQPVQVQKLGNDQDTVETSYGSEFSVVMPGQQHPTCIAQPAPLPCQREGLLHCPSH